VAIHLWGRLTPAPTHTLAHSPKAHPRAAASSGLSLGGWWSQSRGLSVLVLRAVGSGKLAPTVGRGQAGGRGLCCPGSPPPPCSPPPVPLSSLLKLLICKMGVMRIAPPQLLQELPEIMYVKKGMSYS